MNATRLNECPSAFRRGSRINWLLRLRCWLFALLPPFMSAAVSPYPVYLGTYGKSAEAGVYRIMFDPEQGRMSQLTRAAELVRPSFLCYAPNRRVLYSLSQGDDTVVAFALEDGALREINRQPLGVGGACYIGTDAAGQTLIAISYGDGAVVAYPLRNDGGLEPRSALFRHEGRGPNAARQEKAHAHSATFSPDDRFVYICDLGMDRVVAYRLTGNPGGLIAAPEADGVCPPGVGPRHAKITADGLFLYVVNELIGSVSVFTRDLESGALRLEQTVSTLRDDYRGENGSSEIRLHPEERFVYAANRGPDDLAVFSRDAATGRLERIQNIPTGGGHPRNFALSPDGRWLIAANRDANDLTLFSIDRTTGRLTATGETLSVPEPVCVLFP